MVWQGALSLPNKTDCFIPAEDDKPQGSYFFVRSAKILKKKD